MGSFLKAYNDQTVWELAVGTHSMCPSKSSLHPPRPGESRIK